MADYKQDIDFEYLIATNLPNEVDRPILKRLANALLYGVIYVYSVRFKAFYRSAELELDITPQVWSLNKHLNQRFLNDGNNIYIEDGIQYPSNYLFLRAEEKPQFVYTRAEAQPMYLGLRSESGFKAVSFRVRVPPTLMEQKEAIKAWVRKYKLAGKSFDVIEI